MATIRDEPVPPYSYSREHGATDDNPLLRDLAFNRHSLNDGHHVSPYNEGRIDIGLDNLTVRLVQGIEEESFKRTLSRAQQATIGLPAQGEPDTSDWDEMLKGGLQTALESQTIVFEVIGTARAATHQIVRSRRAAFHQQSMRASWFGARPNVRMPESVWRKPAARDAFRIAVEACHAAYETACHEDVSYQDARYILPIGTETYIMCEYTVREFLNVYAYRACSMFQWEICHVVRQMGRILASQHPWLAPYIKISCQDGPCSECGGSGTLDVRRDGMATFQEPCPRCLGTKMEGSKCTFQGWEQVEDQCDFPWAQEELRIFKPKAHLIRSIPLKKKRATTDEEVKEQDARIRREDDDLPEWDTSASPVADVCPACGGTYKNTADSQTRKCEDPWHGPRVLCDVMVDLGPPHGEKKCLTRLPCDIHSGVEDITPVPIDEEELAASARRHPSRYEPGEESLEPPPNRFNRVSMPGLLTRPDGLPERGSMVVRTYDDGSLQFSWIKEGS